MYAELTVTVDGAIEDEARFYDETIMTDYLDGWQREATGDGIEVEVYRLGHPHHPAEACQCSQYVSYLQPWRTFRPEVPA